MFLTNFVFAFLIQQPTELPEHIFRQIDPGRDVVRVDGKNLALLNPIHVAGNVQAIEWSGHNQLHAIEIELGDKVSQTTLHLFNPVTPKDTPIKLKPNETLQQISGIGVGRCYFSTRLSGTDGKESYQFSFVRGAKITQLFSGPVFAGFAEFGGELLLQQQYGGPILWLRDGTVVKEFRFEDERRRAVTSDESGLLMLIFESSPETGRGVRSYSFDPKSGEFSKAERPYGAPQRLLSLSASSMPIQIPGIKESSRAALLMGDQKSEFPQALIAADCLQAMGSPDKKSIAYITQGHAFVRPVMEITDEQLENLLEKKEAQRLMSQVKQVGTGWAIYGSDNDDILPGSGEKTNEMIMPYLKNEKLLQGFAYTYGGGDSSKVADPAKTVLGYVQGKYGRAVVYLDTHARWESFKKKP